MIAVRQVRQQDVDAVAELLAAAGYGLTSLPRDPDLLREKVLEACLGFGREAERPRGESYLFVLEDLELGRIVGTSGIVSKVGGFEPFYSFRLKAHVHESKRLGVRRQLQCLHLVAEHSGPCEIGSLYLHPDYRRHGNGRLLSLCRFLYMAEYPERFDPLVIAEMRGVVGEDGRCPFWEGIGRHFLDVEFPEADRQSVLDKGFIRELMPRHPLYVTLLAPEVQAALGTVHPLTRPALKMLTDEGFREMGMVDIFDGGPVIGCELAQIRTVRESASAVASVGRSTASGGEVRMLAVYEPEFRACLDSAQAEAGAGVHIGRAAVDALGAKAGDRVRHAPVRPRRGG